MPPPLAQPVAQAAILKGKRHVKDKVAQEKAKRKGKEKEMNGLQTSQSESCINQARMANHTNRASMIFENGKHLDSYSDEPSPPDSPIQVHNGYHDRQPPSPSPSPQSVPTPPSPQSLPTPSSPPTPPDVEIQDNDWGFDPFQETQKVSF